jgi:hypothetical protein
MPRSCRAAAGLWFAANRSGLRALFDSARNPERGARAYIGRWNFKLEVGAPRRRQRAERRGAVIPCGDITQSASLEPLWLKERKLVAASRRRGQQACSSPHRAPKERGSVAGLGQPSGRGVAVDLQPGDAQTRDPVVFDRALPGEELLYRELVASANFLEADSAAAHGVDDHGLTPGDPAFRVRGRQVNYGGAGARQDLAPKQIVQPNVVVHGGTINLDTLKNS